MDWPSVKGVSPWPTGKTPASHNSTEDVWFGQWMDGNNNNWWKIKQHWLCKIYFFNILLKCWS